MKYLRLINNKLGELFEILFDEWLPLTMVVLLIVLLAPIIYASLEVM